MEIITEDRAQRPALYRRGSDTDRDYHTDADRTPFSSGLLDNGLHQRKNLNKILS